MVPTGVELILTVVVRVSLRTCDFFDQDASCYVGSTTYALPGYASQLSVQFLTQTARYAGLPARIS